MSEILDIARQYVAAGMSVIPIWKGHKAPDWRLLERTLGQGEHQSWPANDEHAAWRAYTRRMPTDGELVAWFADSDAGIGIVGGAVSGGLVRIDFESPACLWTWRALLRDQDELLAVAATQLPVVETGKGHHVYFRMVDPPGYVLLSSQGEGNSQIVLSETQGEGCYCVAPPSVVPDSHAWDEATNAFVHRKRYAWISGDAHSIPTFDQEIATRFLDAARFSGFWEPEFRAHWGTYVGALHRSGLTIRDRRDKPGPDDRWLGWEHLKALRAYLDRYEALLQAVETAPPPPSSYDVGDDWEEYHDEDYGR